MGKSYRDLQVWKRSILLVKSVYIATSQFPRDEVYGLRSQMRRAAVSIPSNIAEGQARLSQKEFLRFLSNARGSLAELETQVTLSFELGLFEKPLLGTLMEECEEIGRMLNGLYNAIELRVANAALRTENRELGTSKRELGTSTR